MSRSSSRARARFPARLSRVAGGVIGLRTRDVIIAIVAHSRRHRSKSFVLSASISFRSSSRAACDTIRSLSLSFIRSRERSLIPKGHSTKTTKITLKGIETTFPRRGRVTTTLETVPTDLSRVFARLRHRAVFFSLLRAARQFWIESEIRIESNALLLPSFAHPKR